MNDAGRRVRQHFADTDGFTDHVFAACALLGYRFAPRIRDLPQKRLDAFTPNATPANVRALVGGKINEPLIEPTGPTSCASRRRSQRGSSPPARFFANSPLTRARMNWPWHCARSAASSAPCS